MAAGGAHASLPPLNHTLVMRELYSSYFTRLPALWVTDPGRRSEVEEAGVRMATGVKNGRIKIGAVI